MEEPRLGSPGVCPEEVQVGSIAVGGRKWQENESGAQEPWKALELGKDRVRSEAHGSEGRLVLASWERRPECLQNWGCACCIGETLLWRGGEEPEVEVEAGKWWDPLRKDF